MKTPLRVLIVGNSESDAKFIIRQLKKAEYSVHHERVETVKDMKAALENHTWDIVISDYKLSRFKAPAALALLHKMKLDIPFIVVSSTIGEETAVELMKLGANDYLMKDKLERLAPVVKRDLAEAQVRREHKIIDEESLLLAKAVKSTRDCISITDLKNNIMFVNDSFAETYGYSKAELVGKNISLVRSREVSVEESTAIQSGTMAHGWHGEILNKRKDGTDFLVELWTSIIKSKSGHPLAMIGVARDITERKQTEVALRESMQLFQGLFKSSPDAIVLIDPHNQSTSWPIVDCNEAACQMNGYTREELVGHSIDALNTTVGTPEERMAYFENIRQKGIIHFETYHRHKDGHIFPVEVSTSIVSLGGREIVLGIDRDATERKRAEEALAKEQFLLNMLMDNVPDHIYFKDRDSRFIRINKDQAKIFGLSNPIQAAGKTDFDFFTEEHARPAFEDEQAIIRTGKPIVGIEERETWPDGRETWVSTTKMPLRDKEGHIIGTFGISRDVTERKRVEDALKESQALYHSLVEQLPVGVFRKDSEGRYVFVNSYFCRLKGLKEEEILGKTPHELAAYESAIEGSRPPEMKGIQRTLANQGMDHHKLIMNTGKSIELEEIYPQPDGTTKYYQVVKSPVFASDGKIIGTQGVQFDITERKLAEEARHVSEKLFRDLFNASPDAITLIDPHHPSISWPIVDCNEAACHMNGYSREELVGHSIDVLNPVEGTQEERVAYMKNLRKKGTIHVEIFHRHKDGHIFPIEVSTTIITLDGREMVLGIDRDITKRRLAEEKLKESEEQFEKFMANLPAVAFIKDSESRLLYANRTLKELCGWQEAVGRLSTELFPADLARQMIADDKRVMEEGSEIVHEKVTDMNGTEHFFETHKFPFYKKNNEVLLGGVSIDETERILAEKILQESEERYRRLVEFSPDAIAVHSEGKIVYVNPAAITLLGANNASELIGKPFLDIIHPEYRDSIHQQIIAVMKEEYAIPLTEQKFMRLDGSTIEVEVAGLPIVFKEKSAMQIVARDISEQKKLQNQLMQTQKIQSIGTLAGGIAHDFNNILGIILAYTSLLNKNTVSPEKFANSITAINQAVQRGAALVRQILTFARKTDIVFEPMDISELIHELLSMLEQTFPKTITFSESSAENLPFIFADRTQVHQALLNLCINARDAMPEGGSISIATGKHAKEQIIHQFPAADAEAYVCLTVTDTGKGMDETTRLRVFDPFFTTKEKGKGTGLGLSVVYGVVQAHHGFIDLKSEPGFGTTFRLFFPVPTANEQTVDSQEPAQSFEIGGTETILFVEDEDMLVQMVTFLLESKGYKVYCAHDGLEAVNVYQSHKQEIALVLTDMGLPVLTGSDEFKKLKEINPDVKVIFASGYFEPDMKSELLKEGANGFIQKPYEPDHILRMIRQVLDKKV